MVHVGAIVDILDEYMENVLTPNGTNKRVMIYSQKFEKMIKSGIYIYDDRKAIIYPKNQAKKFDVSLFLNSI